MRTPAEVKRDLRKQQGYADNSTWVAVWVQDIKAIQDEAFEAGKKAALKENGIPKES